MRRFIAQQRPEQTRNYSFDARQPQKFQAVAAPGVKYRLTPALAGGRFFSEKDEEKRQD